MDLTSLVTGGLLGAAFTAGATMLNGWRQRGHELRRAQLEHDRSRQARRGEYLRSAYLRWIESAQAVEPLRFLADVGAAVGEASLKGIPPEEDIEVLVKGLDARLRNSLQAGAAVALVEREPRFVDLVNAFLEAQTMLREVAGTLAFNRDEDFKKFETSAAATSKAGGALLRELRSSEHLLP